MLYFMFVLIGFVGGGVSGFLLVWNRLRRLREQERTQEAAETALRQGEAALMARSQDLDRQESALREKAKELENRFVTYTELQNENAVLKRDLHNIDVNVRKLDLDRQTERRRQDVLDARAKEVAGRYLRETIKWIGASLSTNNYAAAKQRLQEVIERCRGIGFSIPPQEEAGFLSDLKAEYERIVRAAFQREEQARIKAQIREEEMRKREIEQELKRLDRERAAIQAALEKALAESEDKHSAEIERLKARLAEAEEKTQRTKSQAELTKSGHVYVISNIGSFGDDVYKIGMTRRLVPQDRVRELGDASVPFPFDVHMMISCDDAPTLENALHKVFHRTRLNKVNPRKEFFRADLEAIRKVVEENHGEVQYVADPEALEYRQSIGMSEEDSDFIEAAYDAAEEDAKAPSAED